MFQISPLTETIVNDRFGNPKAWFTIDQLRCEVQQLAKRTSPDPAHVERASVLAISGRVRDYVSSEEICAWARLLYANSCKLLIVRSESLETQFDPEEKASKDSHFEQWYRYSEERTRLSLLHQKGDAAHHFLTGDWAREWRPPTYEERQMLAMAKQAFKAGLDTTGTVGYSLPLKVAPLPHAHA